jgi:subtilisin family serine protease
MARRSGPKTPKAKSEGETKARPEETKENSAVSPDDAKPSGSGEPIRAPRSLPGREVLGMERATIPPALNDDERRRHNQQMTNSSSDEDDYMIELNLMHNRGVDGAGEDFVAIFKEILPGQEPTLVSKSYYSCHVSLADLRKMVALDETRAGTDRARISIYKVWPDFTVRATLDKSVGTVKADAAGRSFAALGKDIVWAVIDSGVNQDHAHFASNQTLTHPSVAELHFDFTSADGKATVDAYGHGTHVAGIIAGGIKFSETTPYAVYQRFYQTDPADPDGRPFTSIQKRETRDGDTMSGVAPLCRIVSLKVLDENGKGKSSNVIRALNYIREKINGDPKISRIHGVNLSLGYEFDAEMFACGQSPLCVEVDRLVNSGVVVVTAAGNTGYGRVNSRERMSGVGLSNTINDPGNAALAITVGSTHRDSPHTYGVSYFSSKGPTGDGRLKPDLVAPGERITSCAAGKCLQSANGPIPEENNGYIDDSGTSMAAPHVSGAIAAFLSIRREFIQKPIQVKDIFMSTATCLGRERYFQGSGLVDLMRAIQSI